MVSGEKKRWVIDTVINLIGMILVVLAVQRSVAVLMAGHWLNASGPIIFYLLLLGIFLCRKPSKETVPDIRHHVFALGGTFLPLLLQVAEHPNPILTWAFLPVELVGIIIAIIALASLGRGFGIFAANREVKTHGLYRYIRHPLYAGEAIWFLAIMMQNVSVFNVVLYMMQMGCQIKRMQDEESLLRRDPVYDAYFSQVRHRLIPGLY